MSDSSKQQSSVPYYAAVVFIVGCAAFAGLFAVNAPAATIVVVVIVLMAIAAGVARLTVPSTGFRDHYTRYLPGFLLIGVAAVVVGVIVHFM
jgi:hypothetical protein